jgi:hypothetical protein
MKNKDTDWPSNQETERDQSLFSMVNVFELEEYNVGAINSHHVVIANFCPVA